MPPQLKMRLITAFWTWAEEEGMTTYLQIQVDNDTQLPESFVFEGAIVLNITEEATNQLHFADRRISFQTRFGEEVSNIDVAAERIAAIFIKDTTIGLAFPVTDSPASINLNDAKKLALKNPSGLKKLTSAKIAPLKNMEKSSTPRKSPMLKKI